MIVLPFDVENIVKVILSFLLSGVVGFEREIKNKPAGLRTHILVGVGSTIFTILSYKYFPGGDPSRIASYIVAGIGFLGAGTIIHEKEKVIGLTTAASLWLVASIGMAVGVGAYDLAIFGTIVGIVNLLLKKWEIKIHEKI